MAQFTRAWAVEGRVCMFVCLFVCHANFAIFHRPNAWTDLRNSQIFEILVVQRWDCTWSAFFIRKFVCLKIVPLLQIAMQNAADRQANLCHSPQSKQRVNRFEKFQEIWNPRGIKVGMHMEWHLYATVWRSYRVRNQPTIGLRVS